LWFSYVSVNSEDQDLINLLAELRQDFLKENYEYLVRHDCSGQDARLLVRRTLGFNY
jgi:hypothetical protein